MVENEILLDTLWQEAQSGVIGSMLISPEIVGDVMAQTCEDDFNGSLRNIFIAAKQLFAENTPIDAVTVLHKAGGQYQAMIADVLVQTPTAQNYKSYIKLAKEHALVHKARELGGQLTQVFNADEARKLVDSAGKLFINNIGWKSYSMTDLLLMYFNNQDKEPDYLDLGIPKLKDNIYIEQGDFVVLGGRPSVGKTALAIEFAAELAKKKKVGFFSFETGPSKFIDRMVSRSFRVDMDEIKQRSVSDADILRMHRSADAFCGLDLEFIHANGMSVADMQTLALTRKYDVIFVDYLQIINSGLPNAFATEQVRAISIALHNLAQNNKITVIALAQLNRGSRDDAAKAPEMSALKESGQIEQDADVIMFLYRKFPGKKNSARVLKVAKSKEGRQGSFTLEFEGRFQSFTAEGTSFDDDEDDDQDGDPPTAEEFEENEHYERPRRAVSFEEARRKFK
ncbi:MAG: DnaB-like helicase C-terminal domain-containing protein [Clostridia bacterium]